VLCGKEFIKKTVKYLLKYGMRVETELIWFRLGPGVDGFGQGNKFSDPQNYKNFLASFATINI
jgi:hypothetical protein